MKLATLVALIVIGAGALGGLTIVFQNYLVARVVGPSTNVTSVKPGQVIVVDTKSNTTNQITINLCGQGQGCFPIYSGSNTKNVTARIPIGYPKGKSNITVSEKMTPYAGSPARLIYSFDINVE